jgi:hypothetical protein
MPVRATRAGGHRRPDQAPARFSIRRRPACIGRSILRRVNMRIVKSKSRRKKTSVATDEDDSRRGLPSSPGSILRLAFDLSAGLDSAPPPLQRRIIE